MAGFSAEELTAAVDALLRTAGVSVTKLSVTRARDVKSVKDALYELLTTTLLMKPSSFFYLSYLSSNRMVNDLQTLLDALDVVLDAAPGASRSGQRIETTADLTNATASLLNATAALNSASGSVGALGPDIDRATSSLTRFARRELAKNVVVQGEAQPTGEELRQQIAAAWATVRQGLPDVLEHIRQWTTALDELAAASLPRSAAQGIVQRSMETLRLLEQELTGSGSLATSRQALLQVLAIQTVLRRATRLRLPTTSLLAATATPRTVVSPTYAATLSGPFTATGVAGSVTTHGVATPVAPRRTSAVVTTGPLTFPGGPGVAEVAVVVGHTATLSGTPSASYADGAAAETELQGLLGPDVLVTFDPTSSTLTFETFDTSDIAHLRFLADNSARESFVAWAFGGASPSARGIPITLEEARLLLAEVPDLQVSEQVTIKGLWEATRSSVLGEEDRLHVRVLERVGAGFTSNDTEVLVGTLDFEAAGVSPGMLLVVTNAPAAGTYTIEAVSGRLLTLDTAVPATSTPDFYVSPSLAELGDVGDRVQVVSLTGSENSGFFTVTATGPGYLDVTPQLWVPETVTARIFREQLTFSLKNVELGDELELDLPWVGAVAGPLGALVDSVTIPNNPLVAGVSTTDELTLDSSVVNVSGVGIDFLEFDPPVAEASSWMATVWSKSYQDYRSTADASLAEVDNIRDLTELDATVSRLIRGAAYTSTISTPLLEFRAQLEELHNLFRSYTVPRDVAMDAAVAAFREHGLDRALDYLLRLRIAELLSWDVDAVSYTTHLVRQSANAARLVVPTTKLPTSVEGPSQIVGRGFRIT